MRIGYRTIKTAVAVLLALWVCRALGLHSETFAALIAMLALQTTRRQSLLHSLRLFAAYMIGLVLSTLIYTVLAHHIVSMAIFILIAIPVLIRLGLSVGAVSATVVAIHVYVTTQFTPAFFVNEILLIVIGITASLIVNLSYMPSLDKQLDELQTRATDLIRIIIRHYAKHLKSPDLVWTGEEFLTLHRTITEGKKVAVTDKENQFGFRDPHDHPERTFILLEKQAEVLQRILPMLARIQQPTIQGEMLSDFLCEIEQSWNRSENHEETAEKLYQRLVLLRAAYEAMNLPATRSEFEIRASLLQILYELEHFLDLMRKSTKAPEQ